MFEAIQGSLVLIIVALASFIHAIFPFMFPQYVSKVLIRIYYRHFHNHPSPDVQKIIKEERKFCITSNNEENVINFKTR